MDIISSLIISTSLTNQMSGHLKPHANMKKAKIGSLVMILLLILMIVLLIYGLLDFNIEFIAISLVGFVCIFYLLLISPGIQDPNNYSIFLKSKTNFEGFELYYKNEKINIEHKIDQYGKVAFLRDNDKLSCISYANGRKMKNIIKYKIINYFVLWLTDYGYLSDEVTVTFEKL